MSEHQHAGQTDAATRAARSTLAAARFVCIGLAVAAVAALVAAFAAPAREIPESLRPKALMEGLLAILFLAATIVSLGIGWAANIMAARAYRRDNPYRSAVIVAASQCVIFAAYMGVVALVIFFRVKAGGPMRALVSAVASILAGLYFLKAPDFLSKVLYRIPGNRADAPGGKGEE